MTSATSMRETAELTTAMMNNLDELPPTEAPATTTTTAATTGLDLDRDSLSEIFSHLRDPQDLATVPCVCRHWRRAAEEGGEEAGRGDACGVSFEAASALASPAAAPPPPLPPPPPPPAPRSASSPTLAVENSTPICRDRIRSYDACPL